MELDGAAFQACFIIAWCECPLVLVFKTAGY